MKSSVPSSAAAEHNNATWPLLPAVLPRTIDALGDSSVLTRILREVQAVSPAAMANVAKLLEADRGSVFRFWERLSAQDRQGLLRQIAGLDLDLVDRNLVLLEDHDSLAQRTAGHLAPPEVHHPSRDPDADRILALGEEVLAEGWLAVVEGAGGTGSRFFKASGDLPKGLYPISPTGNYTFFELRMARLKALRRLFGRPIPYIVMVSDATEEETRDYFERNDFFHLRGEILIVRQRSLPYLDKQPDGGYDLVLESPSRIAVGGYGHADFTKHVLLLDEVRSFLAPFGTRYGQWLQIDNPLAVIGHRYLLGKHRQVEPSLRPECLAMSFIALEKEIALEAAGLLVRRGDGLAVWEYSDMDRVSKYLLEDNRGRPRLAVARHQDLVLISPDDLQDDDRLVGLPELPPSLRTDLRYRWRAINPNLVLVSLQSVWAHPEDNPPLVAAKSCRYIDADGSPGDPARKFLKFEAFLFDGLNDGAVVAEERSRCFAPTKNADGTVDSPDTARRWLIQHAADLLRELGWTIADAPDTRVELTGLLELSPEELAIRIGREGHIGAGATLSIHGIDVRIGDGLNILPGAELRIRISERIQSDWTGPHTPLTLPPGLQVRETVILEWDPETVVGVHGSGVVISGPVHSLAER